jgi:hypothetical protein
MEWKEREMLTQVSILVEEAGAGSQEGTSREEEEGTPHQEAACLPGSQEEETASQREEEAGSLQARSKEGKEIAQHQDQADMATSQEEEGTQPRLPDLPESQASFP